MGSPRSARGRSAPGVPLVIITGAIGSAIVGLEEMCLGRQALRADRPHGGKLTFVVGGAFFFLILVLVFILIVVEVV